MSPAASHTGRSSPRYVCTYVEAMSSAKTCTTPQCYAQTDVPSQCAPQADDYLECLHHTKEVRILDPAHHFNTHVSSVTLSFVPGTSVSSMQIKRAKQVKAEFLRKAEHQAHEGRKAADILADGVIVGVGLIQRGEAAHSK